MSTGAFYTAMGPSKDALCQINYYYYYYYYYYT